MAANRSNNTFTYIADYSGLIIKLRSDDMQLLGFDFIKEKKKPEPDSTIPAPIKKTLSFLDDYFRGVKSNIEIIFNTKFSEDKNTTGSEKLLLDMRDYTEKEISVYRELLKVKSGKTISYSDIALKSGIPRGARFAGNCMAGNRYPVIIPCHRVINKDGSTGNYSGGVGIKEFLLRHERDKFKQLDLY